MANLTSWEAEKGGYFQGSATPGQIVGRAIDWGLAKLRKLPKLHKLEPFRDHWSTWPEGNPLEINDVWLDHLIENGRLPSRQQVTYSGARADKAEMRSMMGSHVIVEMINTDRKTRHRCILLDNILIATAAGWRESLKAA